MEGDFSPISYETISDFFYRKLEENLKYLSKSARHYIYEVLSNIDNENIIRGIHMYREKPFAVMLEEAEREERRVNKQHLYKSLGDTCMFVGGICRTDRVDDGLLCFFGRTGYIGAGMNEEVKEYSYKYYELAESFGYILNSLRKIKSPNRLKFVTDAALLRMYDESGDKDVLEELRRRGIIPIKSKWSY